MECPMVLGNVLTRVQKTHFTSTDLYDNFLCSLYKNRKREGGGDVPPLFGNIFYVMCYMYTYMYTYKHTYTNVKNNKKQT